MPSLKDLKNRIASVKSTQKITSAMKMVAAAKLRRAQEQAEAARPYAERMDRMLATLAGNLAGASGAPPLLAGTGRDETHLLVPLTADRGLCGGFNTTIVRETRRTVQRLQQAGKTVKILCVGRKARDQLRRDFRDLIVHTLEDVQKPRLDYGKADALSARILALFEAGEFDVCTMIYNRFQSALTQVVTPQQLIPYSLPSNDNDAGAAATTGPQAQYEFEPDEEAMLALLLPRNLGVQIYRGLLESAASEHGARMTAMDNATRNAGDMIGRLTLEYNRSRQAAITKELIEIISGAEAV